MMNVAFEFFSVVVYEFTVSLKFILKLLKKIFCTPCMLSFSHPWYSLTNKYQRDLEGCPTMKIPIILKLVLTMRVDTFWPAQSKSSVPCRVTPFNLRVALVRITGSAVSPASRGLVQYRGIYLLASTISLNRMARSYGALQALSAAISRFTSDFQSQARIVGWEAVIKKPLHTHISYTSLSYVSRC